MRPRRWPEQRILAVQAGLYRRAGRLQRLIRSVRRRSDESEVLDGCFCMLNGLRFLAPLLSIQEAGRVARAVRRALDLTRSCFLVSVLNKT